MDEIFNALFQTEKSEEKDSGGKLFAEILAFSNSGKLPDEGLPPGVSFSIDYRCIRIADQYYKLVSHSFYNLNSPKHSELRLDFRKYDIERATYGFTLTLSVSKNYTFRQVMEKIQNYAEGAEVKPADVPDLASFNMTRHHITQFNYTRRVVFYKRSDAINVSYIQRSDRSTDPSSDDSIYTRSDVYDYIIADLKNADLRDVSDEFAIIFQDNTEPAVDAINVMKGVIRKLLQLRQGSYIEIELTANESEMHIFDLMFRDLKQYDVLVKVSRDRGQTAEPRWPLTSPLQERRKKPHNGIVAE